MFTCNFFRTKPLILFAVNLLGGGIRIENKELSEEELSRQMQDGDDHAFEILYERYFDKIYAFIIRRVGHREIAEDLVSNIFLKAFAARACFVWKTSFKSWLYQIANNTLIDHYRSRKQTVEFDPELHDTKSASTKTAFADTLFAERKILEDVLAKLDFRTKKIIHLKFFGEMDNQEIAEIMKISVNNVGVILHRGLKKCAKLLPKNL